MIQEFSRAADRERPGDPRVLKNLSPRLLTDAKVLTLGNADRSKNSTQKQFLEINLSLNQDRMNSLTQDLSALSVVLNVFVFNFETILL